MKEVIENKVGLHRNKQRLTQEELAKKIGVTRQTVIALEKGHYTPSVLLALKLAKLFNQSVDNLFKIKYEK